MLKVETFLGEKECTPDEALDLIDIIVDINVIDNYNFLVDNYPSQMKVLMDKFKSIDTGFEVLSPDEQFKTNSNIVFKDFRYGYHKMTVAAMNKLGFVCPYCGNNQDKSCSVNGKCAYVDKVITSFNTYSKKLSVLTVKALCKNIGNHNLLGASCIDMVNPMCPLTSTRFSQRYVDMFMLNEDSYKREYHKATNNFRDFLREMITDKPWELSEGDELIIWKNFFKLRETYNKNKNNPDVSMFGLAAECRKLGVSFYLLHKDIVHYLEYTTPEERSLKAL